MNLNHLKAKVEKIVTLSDEEWEFFIADISLKKLNKGAFLWQPGDKCNHLVFINEGVFRYFYNKENQEISLQFMFAHSFMIDYPSFINEEQLAYYFEALEDAEVLMIPKKRIYEAVEKYRTWERFGRITSEKNAVEISKRKNSLLFDSPLEQYLKLIAQRPKIFEKVPLHMIATYLGITREHLSRIRRKLANK